jgi:hypothetical protein
MSKSVCTLPFSYDDTPERRVPPCTFLVACRMNAAQERLRGGCACGPSPVQPEEKSERRR